jgi:hypothetical protein
VWISYEKGNKFTTRIKTVVGVLAAVPALAIPASAGATTLLASGSSAELPALQALFKGYKKVKPSVNIIYNANGGNAGVKDVQNGVSQFAVETRPQLNTDQHTSFAKLFLDGLCVGVNPASKLSNLSITRTRRIFTDVITNWSGVPGSNLTTTIDPVGRDSSAGTYTLPGGSSALAVQKAERAAALNGATAPGVISQSDFRVTPAPAAGDYVIYSGEFRAKTAADRALAKLRTRFPAAKVIAIQAVGASAGAGAVLATSTYGSAHQLTGAKPTPAQVSADRSLINRTTHLIGSNYVNAQKGLPDQTVLP